MGQGFAMVPVIAGMPAAHIKEAIFAYVDGASHCVREPRMCETVAALSESQVTEFAEYYAGKERGSPGEQFDQDIRRSRSARPASSNNGMAGGREFRHTSSRLT